MSALALGDVRFRSRRADGGPPLLLPSFLSATDRQTAAAIDTVCRYLTSLAGRPRREYDADVPARVTGDRRLGHGLSNVCLDWYRWVALDFAEALPARVCAALAAAGIGGPSDLRLRLFDLVNAEYAGFVPSAQREQALARLAASLGLIPADGPMLDRALTLDAEAEAIMRAPPSQPAASEVAGRYNRALLAALLRQTMQVVVTLRAPSGGLIRRLYAICHQLGVYCDIDQQGLDRETFRLTLAGPDAVVGPPAAAGPRLATVALRLLRGMGQSDTIAAELDLRGRPYRLALAATLLRLPGFDRDEEEAAGETAEGGQRFDSSVEARLARDFRVLERQRRASGWRLLREPAPLLAGNRVLLPDFALLRGELRVFVEVVGFWTRGYLAKKRAALEALPPDTKLILTVASETAPAFADLPFAVLPYGETPPVAEIIAAAEHRFGDFVARTMGGAERLREACRDAEGWIPEQGLAVVLGCQNTGEVLRALADSPPPAGWEHVTGAGLWSDELRQVLTTALQRLRDAGSGPLSLPDFRRLSGIVLPTDDEALVSLLERLPDCVIERLSLFELQVRPLPAATTPASDQAAGTVAAGSSQAKSRRGLRHAPSAKPARQ